MANKSGLGIKEQWANHMHSIQQAFDGYAAAHSHYVQAVPDPANHGAYISVGGNSSHNHSVVQEGWPDYHYGAPAPKLVTPEQIEEVKPFIRLVIERMLALMATEANWVKGQSTAWNSEAHVEQYCLIGALARATQELGLAVKGHTELDAARRRVGEAVQAFLDMAVAEDKGFNSMPSFNDSSETTYEDVRLWLKSLFDKLD